MTEFHTLQPGLLVSMQTSIKGNTHYRTQELEADHVDASGRRRARWETERVVHDPEEHEAAIKQRTKIRGLILSVCSQSAFGLLCPNSKEADLRDAIAEARSLTEEFNATAKVTRMSVNVIYGRIAQDDVDAVRAITGEIRSLMEDMQDGVKSLNVKAIRDAANKAKAVGEMLTPDAKGRLQIAIDAARKSARQISKAGEAAAREIDRAAIARIDMARTSFLDMDTDGSELKVPAAQGRSFDMDMAV